MFNFFLENEHMSEKDLKIKRYNRIVSIISEVLIIAGLAITFSTIFVSYNVANIDLVGMAVFGIGIGFVVGFAQAEQKIVRLYSSPSSMPSSQQKNYCSSCGRENSSEAIFCNKCGKKILKV
jgi:ribosomal protein L40E